MKFGDMTCQIFLRNIPPILHLHLHQYDLSLNLLADYPFFSFSSLRGVLPKYTSISFSWWKTSELSGACRIKADTLAWPSHKVAPSPVFFHQKPCAQPKGTSYCCARKPYPLITVHFQMLLPLNGFFILILATHNRLSMSWGLDGVYLREKFFLSAHYLHCAWQMVIRRFSMNVILMEGWTNEWTNGWVLNKCMNQRVNESISRWLEGWMKECMKKWRDEWKNMQI